MTTPTRTTMTPTETTTRRMRKTKTTRTTTKLMHAFYGLYPVLAFKKFQRVLRISFKDVEKYKEVLFLFLFCSFAIFFFDNRSCIYKKAFEETPMLFFF